MNHRTWDKNSVCHMRFVDVEAEHNALYKDWKRASLEAERLATVNGSLCDKIAELESVRIDYYTDFISGYQIFGSMENVKAVKNIVSDLRDTYREIMDKNNRLCRDIDEARQALKQNTRVPFLDEHIEAMARAANDAYANFWISKDWPKTDIPRDQHWRMWDKVGEPMKESRIVMIRAALAAGGLEPCAVPLNTERASDDELVEMGRDGFDRFYDQECGDKESIDAYYAAIRAVRARVEAPLLAEIQRLKVDNANHVKWKEWAESYTAVVKTVRDSLWVDSDSLSDHVETLGERNAALQSELEAVKAERDKADAKLKAVQSTFEETHKAYLDANKRANDRAAELAALRQRDAVPVKVRFDVTAALVEEVFSAGDWAEYSWQAVMDYLAAHAVIDAPAGVAGEKPKLRTDRGGGCLYCAKPIPSEAVTCPHCGWDGEYPITKTPVLPTPIPTPDQVEALARVLRDAHWEYHGLVKPADSAPEFYSACARAAFEHIGRVPVWLGPTRAQAEEKWKECQDLWDSGQEYSDWLLPLLPESAPVGVELDVTADELAAKMWGFFDAQVMAPQILDLFRSRIRPVYECKECARLKDRFSAMQEEQIAMNDKILAALESVKARAALEGE